MNEILLKYPRPWTYDMMTTGFLVLRDAHGIEIDPRGGEETVLLNFIVDAVNAYTPV